MENNKKLSLGRMLAFASADIFGGGSFNITNFLYPGYVAIAVGLPARTAGLIMMAVGIFDAITDPIMGFLSDKMRVRFGTRRGGLLATAPLIIISLFAAFYPYTNPDDTTRFMIVLMSYIFFSCPNSSHDSVFLPLKRDDGRLHRACSYDDCAAWVFHIFFDSLCRRAGNSCRHV